jgi:hypothetical protein
LRCSRTESYEARRFYLAVMAIEPDANRDATSSKLALLNGRRACCPDPADLEDDGSMDQVAGQGQVGVAEHDRMADTHHLHDDVVPTVDPRALAAHEVSDLRAEYGQLFV